MGWFKAFMLGGPYHTIGSVRALRRGGLTTDLRVHVLEPKNTGQPHRISLELVSTGFLAYDTRSVTLTSLQASNVVSLLQQAIASSGLTSA